MRTLIKKCSTTLVHVFKLGTESSDFGLRSCALAILGLWAQSRTGCDFIKQQGWRCAKDGARVIPLPPRWSSLFMDNQKPRVYEPNLSPTQSLAAGAVPELTLNDAEEAVVDNLARLTCSVLHKAAKAELLSAQAEGNEHLRWPVIRDSAHKLLGLFRFTAETRVWILEYVQRSMA